MKKILLSLVLITLTTFGFSQVVFYVYPPAGTTGSYGLTYAASNTWIGMPDMTDPANNVTDTIALALDAVDPFNDICDSITNPEELDGKIAMLWRGACTFVSKAQKCQEAGAVAVIIINHSGEPVGMNGGSEIEINIPVIMISTADGQAIEDEINGGGTVTALIGQIQGLFENNVGSLSGDYVRFQEGAHRENSASLADEVVVGTWIKNFGTSAMDNVSLNAVINAEGSEIYNETSATPITIPVGDSVYVTMPNYTGGLSSQGIYTLTYNVLTNGVDEFDGDNQIVCNINVNASKYALCRVDENEVPIVNSGGVQPNGMGNGDSYSLCTHFRESNASTMQVNGLSFRAVTNAGDELTGELMTASIYAWNDDFVDLNDANLAFNDIEQVASKDYEYTEDLQNENIYVEFDTPYYLEDDVRYLFCITSFANTIFLGTDNNIDFEANLDNYLQPLTVIENNDVWNAFGFGTDRTANVVTDITQSEASVDDNDVAEQLIAYPNPANSEISIPFNGSSKVVAIDVYDVAGKLVISQTSKQNSSTMLTMDVSSLENGYYSFKALFENGKTSTFNVVVNK